MGHLRRLPMEAQADIMWKRNSFVQDVNVKGLLSTSVFEIGDTVQLAANSYVIAVQRKKPIFYGKEGNFQAFKIFSQPIQIPNFPIPPPTIRKFHESSNISVGSIHIKGMAASSIMQIGNTNHACLESRVLHIRQIPNNGTKDTK